MRRYIADLGGEQNEVTMLSVNMIAEVYGLFLGFMIVALWGAFEAANSGVSAEARPCHS